MDYFSLISMDRMVQINVMLYQAKLFDETIEEQHHCYAFYSIECIFIDKGNIILHNHFWVIKTN
jgi:hypothetical protein